MTIKQAWLHVSLDKNYFNSVLKDNDTNESQIGAVINEILGTEAGGVPGYYHHSYMHILTDESLDPRLGAKIKDFIINTTIEKAFPDVLFGGEELEAKIKPFIAEILNNKLFTKKSGPDTTQIPI
jgi:hypothetical protein